jgi:hypothetical protein
MLDGHGLAQELYAPRMCKIARNNEHTVMLAVEVFVDVGEVFVLETVLDLVEVLNVVLVVVALTDVDVVDVVLAIKTQI